MPEDFIAKGLVVEDGPDGTIRLNIGKSGPDVRVGSSGKVEAPVYLFADLTDQQARILIGRLMKATGIELVALTPEGDLIMKDL